MKTELVIVLTTIAAALSRTIPTCTDRNDGHFEASSENLRNYWLCIGGIAWSFQCDVGYLANESSRSCEPVRSTYKRLGGNVCEGKKQDALVNNPKRCSDYWVCVDEIPVAVQCRPEKPNFNPKVGACQTDDEFHCSDDVVTTTEKPKEPEIINVCEGKNNGHFINDPRKCAAYFLCWNQVARPQTCENNLPFNEAEQMCDWELQCTEPISSTSAPPPIIWDPTLACRGREDGYFVNDIRSCTAYFLCWNEKTYERNCHNNLPFNEEEQLCDWQLDCEDTIVLPPATTTAEAETSTHPDVTSDITTYSTVDWTTSEVTSEPTTQWTIDETSEWTTDRGSDSTPNEETSDSTTQWTTYETSESTTEDLKDWTTDETSESTTVDDWTTDETSETTTDAETDSTTETTENTPTTPAAPSVDCPVDGIVNVVFPGSCTRYWMCINGTPYPRECAKGLHFDAALKSCNMPAQANCARDICPVEDDPENMVTHPSKTDCSVFFVCSGGELFEDSCLPGLHWNQKIAKCDLPANADCQIGEP